MTKSWGDVLSLSLHPRDQEALCWGIPFAFFWKLLVCVLECNLLSWTVQDNRLWILRTCSQQRIMQIAALTEED